MECHNLGYKSSPWENYTGSWFLFCTHDKGSEKEKLKKAIFSKLC